ncbi:hypothetical protein GCK72_001184 [Caenorhabditis remanei]|uniref:Hexokinase C-terminal domain-containing protein n=2 Tax=Caenorhabditis remanei TaxID=31234 RepID=E3LXR8_CAERE|nr:hypothetical protein GCK72_001184 [Caenorhabditis remanei]EFO84720.1 hypothetical protein CRE_03698 [Caenorhabditis remanei]KAF1769367.1 hypothetical protein GCK72_001184 [Caenorhabditis remanei]
MSSIVCHPLIDTQNGIATDARIKKQRPPPLVVSRPRDLIQDSCERLVLSDQQLRRIMTLMIYRFHPTYPTLLNAKIAELIVGDIEYKLMLSEDGSGRGGALVAAVATRLKEEKLAALCSSSSSSN